MDMVKKFFQKSACFLLCVLLTTALIAEGTVACFAADNQTKVIRVVFPMQEGMTEIDENGNYLGYTYDYLQRIAQFTNWKYEFITYDGMSENDAVTKSMEMVQEGEADIMGCTLKLEGMEGMYDYPEQGYGAVYTTLSVLENNADITETNFWLKHPLRVAVMEQAETRRAELKEYFTSIGAEYEEILCKDMEEQTQKLIDGDADAILRISLSFVKGTRQIAQFAPRPYYLVTTKGNTEITEQLNRAIRLVNENYPYFQSRLYQKYFGDSSGGFLLSDKEKTYIKKHAVINALYMTDNAPYSEEKDGKPWGILVSLLDDFAEEVNAEVVYTPVSSLEELADYRSSANRYDCVLGNLFCMDYDTQYSMVTTNTVFTSDEMQFYKRNTTMKPLEESIVALHKGCGFEEQMKNAKAIQWYDNIEECLKAVSNGECDTGFADNYSLEYAMNKNNILCYTVPVIGREAEIQIYMLNTGDLNFLSIFNRYLNSLEDSTVYQYIEDGTRIDSQQGLLYFAESNPIAAAATGLFVLSLIAFCIAMSVFVRKLRIANVKLSVASSAKSDFLSRISHDMRTPLNGILGLLHLIKDKPECVAVETELTQMEMSGKYLLELINDTLDVEKIETGHLELHPVVYEGKEIIQNVVTLIKPEMDRKHLQLNLEMNDAKENMLYVDVGRVEQLLMNILGNSIKFTPEYGTIDIMVKTTETKDNTITNVITIRDNGIGMSEEFLPHLFEPFSQEDNSTTSQYKGTGLGMTICKQIITLMNGEINVKSKLGEGTEFTFSLEMPMATSEQIAKADIPYKMEKLESLTGKKILLFEDHPLNAEIAKRLLEKKEIIVERAENGKLGLEMFKNAAENYYDGILMDIRMPVMDGIEATREIRKLGGEYAANVPIIAMTANALDEDVRNCKEAGMNAHLSKPIEPDKLYQTLVAAMK